MEQRKFLHVCTIRDARYVNRALFFGLGTPEDIASAMFAAIHAVGEGALHARTPSYVEFDYPCGGHQSQGAVYWDSDLEEPMIRAVSDVVAAPRSLICSGGPELEAVIAWQLPKWFSLWDGVARLSLFARDAVGPFRDSFTRTPRGFPPLRLSIYDA